MPATLSLYSLTLAHGDPTGNSNAPALRFVDWKRQFQAIPVANPKTEGLQVPPGGTRLVFDGTRTTTIDGTTAFDLNLAKAESARYRFTHRAGTAPGLRTDRGLDLTGISLVVTAQRNGSLLVEALSGTPFADLQAGDEVFIPGMTTGDVAGPFSVMNEGRWSVLGQDGSSVTLVRVGADELGVSESANVTPSAPEQFFAYSADGVQVGDKAEISAGFAAPAQCVFELLAVTSRWFEVVSTSPLAEQYNIIPGTTGLRFYSSAKRFLRVEADQECVLQLNGDTSSSMRLSPWTAGDAAQVAEFTKVGPTWSLRAVNRSALPLNLTVISAE